MAAIAAATLLGAWLRLRTLGAEDLWVDEALTLAVSSVSYAQLWFAPTDPTPPLYYTLHKLVLDAARDTETVRALACAFGILSVSAMGWLFWRIAGPLAGALGTAFLAVGTAPIAYAQEARAYSLFLLLVVLSSITIHRSVDGRGLLAVVMTLTLTIYTHFAGLLWAASAMAALLWMAVSRGWLRRWLFAAAALAVLSAPALWIAVRVAGNSSSVGGWPGPAGALRDLTETAFVRPPMPGATLLGAGLGIASLIGLILLSRERRGRVVAAALLLYPMLLAVACLITPIWLDRVLIVVVVPGLLGLAVLMSRLPGWTGVAAGIGTAGVLLVSHLAYERAAPRAWDWRAAAERIAAEADPTDAILTCQHYEYPPLRVYTADKSTVPFYAALGQGWLADFGAPATQGNPWAAHDDRSGSATIKAAEVAEGLSGRLFVVRSDHCSAPNRRAMLEDALEPFGAIHPIWTGRKVEVLVTSP